MSSVHRDKSSLVISSYRNPLLMINPHKKVSPMILCYRKSSPHIFSCRKSSAMISSYRKVVKEYLLRIENSSKIVISYGKVISSIFCIEIIDHDFLEQKFINYIQSYKSHQLLSLGIEKSSIVIFLLQRSLQQLTFRIEKLSKIIISYRKFSSYKKVPNNGQEIEKSLTMFFYRKYQLWVLRITSHQRKRLPIEMSSTTMFSYKKSRQRCPFCTEKSSTMPLQYGKVIN